MFDVDRKRLPALVALFVAAASVPCALPAQPFSAEPLPYVARRFALSDPDSRQGRMMMHSSLYALVFEAGSRKLNFDGTLIWMNAPLTPRGNAWVLSTADVAGTLAPLLYSRDAVKGRAAGVILLDPGHGGEDTGAVSRRKVHEKKAVLDVANRVAAKLGGCGLQVHLTRSKDTALSLRERTETARQLRANLFISIHLNATPNPRASGLETFLLTAGGFASTTSTSPDYRLYAGNAHDAANLLLAYYVHKGVLSTTHSADRGVKRARFEVLRNAPCPATLVECAFVSNSRDEGRLLSDQGRDQIAEGIARGILTYVSRTEAANALSIRP